MSTARLRLIRDLVDALGADLVVFTGDQIDRRPQDADRFASGFAGLAAPLGAYGILGNHDHYIDPTLSEAALREAGVRPLVNQSLELSRGGSRLALIGLEDLNASDGRRPDFDLVGRHPGAFRLCLCHQPRGWREARSAGAHLTLSGHTHGGQIVLTPRTLNVARLHSRYVAGPYRREDAFLYVSRGVGVGSVRIRVGAPPEVDLITLRRAGYIQLAAA
jgi:predicted MPP superfamily phosphohydrolase